MIRFAVLGNCQAEYVAHCVRFLARHCEADAYFLSQPEDITPDFQKFADRSASYDYVLVQPQYSSLLSGLTTLVDRRIPIVHYPTLYFAGYHPDITYIYRRDSSFLRSPVGDYHSALAFLCYTLGLSVEQTLTKFNSSIFDRLGYFATAFWRSAEERLLESGRDAHMPLDHHLRSWIRRGCFMYSVNHPKIFVLADVAASAIAACGVTASPHICEYYVSDDIKLGPIWPVYPEVAIRFGLDGCYCFKGSSLLDRTNPYFDLHEFVEASFLFYHNYDLADMRCSRVDEWKSDPDLVSFVIGDSVPVAYQRDFRCAMPESDGASRDLPCTTQVALGQLDRINSSLFENKGEVTTSFGESTVIVGWAADPESGAVASGVDVVVDDIPYRAIYGIPRSDVAQALANPALENSGFRFSLGPGVLNRGIHSFAIRVLAANGEAYCEGPSGRLIVD